MSVEVIACPLRPRMVSFTVSFFSSGTAVMLPTRLPSTAAAASSAFLAAAVAVPAAASAVSADLFAVPAAFVAVWAALAAPVAALSAFVAAALATAAASSAGFRSNATGASTTSWPRIAGRLLILSSEVTSASSSTLWLSDLMEFRMSFFNSFFSDSVSAINYPPYLSISCTTCE